MSTRRDLLDFEVIEQHQELVITAGTRDRLLQSLKARIAKKVHQTG